MFEKSGITTVIIIILVSIFVATGAVFYFVNFKTDNNSKVTLVETVQEIVSQQVTPTATPFLFEELTIPYLRSRDYTSQLSELREYAGNGNYTSYLTSYDSDGFRVNGLLTIPKGEVPEGGWPAVVFVHGYIPPASYTTTGRYNDYVNYLARNGLVVFKIDLRGHGDSEGDPGGGYYSGDYVIDVLNARAALQNFQEVNPDKIGLWGHSMSGNVTFRSFVAQKVPAIVVWAGAVYTYEDQQQFGIDDNSYRPPAEDSPVRRRRQELTETHGSFDPNSDFWKQVVPTNYLDGVEGAVQIHHALDDSVVSIDYSRNLMDILDGTNIAHELLEYGSGGHNMTGSSFTAAMQKTVEFYKREL